MKYRLYPTVVVSTSVEYEAESLDEAINAFYENGLPGLMFLDHTYPDVGEWEIDEDEARLEYPNG